MNKNIYEMLNDSDINLDEYEKEEFNDVEKGKMKKSLRQSMKKSKGYKKSKVAAVVAAGAIVLLFSTSTGNKVLASINIFGIASRVEVESALEDYKTVIDESIAKDELIFELNEIIEDGNETIVSTSIKNNDEKIIDYAMSAGEEIYINNGELVVDTQKIEIDYKFILDNGDEVTIEKYTSNSVGQNIYYKKIGEENKYNIKLVGEDDLGNKVEFLSRNSLPNGGTWVRDDLDGPLSSEAKSITLTPYVVEFSKESGGVNNDFKQVGEEFTIKLK